MEKVDHRTIKYFAVTLPWALVRFIGRIIRRFFVALGVLVALIVLGYVGFEFIVETKPLAEQAMDQAKAADPAPVMRPESIMGQQPSHVYCPGRQQSPPDCAARGQAAHHRRRGR